MATQEGTQTLPFHTGSVNLHFYHVFVSLYATTTDGQLNFARISVQ